MPPEDNTTYYPSNMNNTTRHGNAINSPPATTGPKVVTQADINKFIGFPGMTPATSQAVAASLQKYIGQPAPWPVATQYQIDATKSGRDQATHPDQAQQQVALNWLNGNDPSFKASWDTFQPNRSFWNRIHGQDLVKAAAIGAGAYALAPEAVAGTAGTTATGAGTAGALDAFGGAGGAVTAPTTFSAPGTLGGTVAGGNVLAQGGSNAVTGPHIGEVASTPTVVPPIPDIDAATAAGNAAAGTIAGTTAGTAAAAANSAVDNLNSADGFDWSKYLSDHGFDIANAAGSLGSAYLTNDAAKTVADENARQFDLIRSDNEPYRNAGVNAINHLNGPNGLIEQGYQDFKFNPENDSILQGNLDQANKEVRRYMAQRGFGNSGNILNEIGKRNIYENNKYQNDAYNRQRGTWGANYGKSLNKINQYGTQAGFGQTANNVNANAGTNFANSNNANTWNATGGYNNAIQGGISNYLLSNYLRK